MHQSAAQIGRDIAAGKADPVELAETYLARASADPGGRIYARLTPERARAEAGAARQRATSGTRRGPLDGVPISWKDLFDSAGTATEAGSKLLEGRIPATDALVLQRATRAGLVCLGKTHMSELAFSGLGLNPMTATSPNANDPAAAPGGSSSGAAASVAFDMAAAAIGSDTGGSVRVPAAWNDLVGLKTTAGAIPLTGCVTLCPSFDTIGPLTRTVEDAALLHAVLSDSAPVDLAQASLRGLRFLVLETVALDDLREAPARSFDSALARLERAGATLARGRMPFIAEAMALSGVLFAGEAYAECGELIESAPEKMFAPILERFRGGRDVLLSENYRAWKALNRYRAAWAEAVAGYDAVLIPSAANLPPNLARLRSDDAYYRTENLLTLRNTRIGNLMGLCAVTLPTGTPSCGIMAMGRPFEETALLRVAHAMELALTGEAAR